MQLLNPMMLRTAERKRQQIWKEETHLERGYPPYYLRLIQGQPQSLCHSLRLAGFAVSCERPAQRLFRVTLIPTAPERESSKRVLRVCDVASPVWQHDVQRQWRPDAAKGSCLSRREGISQPQRKAHMLRIFRPL